MPTLRLRTVAVLLSTWLLSVNVVIAQSEHCYDLNADGIGWAQKAPNTLTVFVNEPVRVFRAVLAAKNA